MFSVSESRHDGIAPESQPAAVATSTNSQTNDISSSVKRKQPPPEKSEDVRRRSYVIASFWAIVLFLGLPIWWKTTTIYRAELPLSQMLNWADGKVGLIVVYTTIFRHTNTFISERPAVQYSP